MKVTQRRTRVGRRDVWEEGFIVKESEDCGE